jgi:hypothetical protein
MEYPNLAGIATDNLVESKGGKGFSASYINWARTMNLLHVHAPGWQPNMLVTGAGNHVFPSPGGGGYIMIQFVNGHDAGVTQAWPQAIMDNRNNDIPYEKITARDITDSHRRGVCAAAAGLFGLAYELWAKMPLEPYQRQDRPEPVPAQDTAQLGVAATAKKLGIPGEPKEQATTPEDLSSIEDSELTSKNLGEILLGHSIKLDGEDNYRPPDRNEIKTAVRKFLGKTMSTNVPFSQLKANEKRLTIHAAKTGKLWTVAGYDCLPF